jgi:hypothetical protein
MGPTGFDRLTGKRQELLTVLIVADSVDRTRPMLHECQSPIVMPFYFGRSYNPVSMKLLNYLNLGVCMSLGLVLWSCGF